MSKISSIKKITGLFFIFIFSLLILTSCSSNEVSKIYKDKLTLAKDNVYDLVTIDELENIYKTSNEFVYAFYGSPENFETLKVITKIDTQAKQFKVEKVYYLNEPDCDKTILKKTTNIKDPNWLPTMMVFKDQELIFDTSSSDTRAKFFSEVAKGVDYDLVCGYIFRDLVE